MHGAERGLQAFGPAPGLGVDEGGTEDVRQRLHEPVDVGKEAARLLSLDAAPGMLDQAPRKLVVAVGDLAVDLQVSGCVGEVRRCPHPQIRQHPARAPGDAPAELALGTEDISAHPFPLEAARHAVPEHVVNERGQRAYACFVARIVSQHDGVVVPEGRKVAIGRQQRRPHREVDWLEIPARRSRQVERDLPLDLGCLFHDQAATRSSPSGQTVNLSSSASRLARMRPAGRAWPACRSSS